MSLFGLLLSGLGLGYAVHKDNQKFANMNREATQLYGRGINESFDDEAVQNKYFWELKKYFDERYDYYINNCDYIMNHTNINEIHRTDITPEQLQQHFAGSLAYDDMFKKYAPDYVRWFCDPCGVFTPKNTPYDYVSFSNITRALARKEAYRLGFKPAHIQNMNCAVGGKKLYFYGGVFGACIDGPSDFDNIQWDKEPFKYNCHGYMVYGMPVCERK